MEKIKKLIVVLLVAVMTLPLFPLGVLAEENSRSVSEESVYSPIIEKYIEGINNKWGAEQFKDAGLNPEFGYFDFDKIDYMQKSGYYYQDVDGNGVKELFIATENGFSNHYPDMFLDMYTIVNNQAVLVGRAQSRGRYYICNDSKIGYMDSSGAFFSIWSYYSYKDTELNLIESVAYDAQTDENNPWFYTVNSDLGDVSKYKPITEEKAREIRNSYEDMPIDYTPFLEYKKVNKDGFSHNDNGWPILNWSDSFEYGWFYKIPIERYREVYGNSFSKQEYKQVSKNWGGNCAGLSMSAILFYNQELNIQNYKDTNGLLNKVGYDEVNDVFGRGCMPILKQNSELTKLIERYQIYQNSEEFYRMWKIFLNKNIGDYDETGKFMWYPKKMFKMAVDGINNNKSKPFYIQVNWKYKGNDGGHALVTDTTKKPVDLGNGWYQISLYDCNTPYFNKFAGKNHPVAFDKSNERYLYVNIENGGWNMEIQANAGTEQLHIGKREDDTYVCEESEIQIFNIDEVPSNFNTKATYRKSKNEGAAASFISDNIEIMNENQEILFKIENGNTVTQKEGVEFVRHAEVSEVCHGKIILPEGNYTVQLEGESKFSVHTNKIFNGISADGAVKSVWSTQKNEMLFNAIEDCKASVVLQNYIGGEDYAAINIEKPFLKNEYINIGLNDEQKVALDTNIEDNVKVCIEKGGDTDETVYNEVSIDSINNQNILYFQSDIVSPNEVTLDKQKLELKCGETTTLAATIAPANATNKNVSWSSSDEAIATVKDGMVTAAAGEATITVITEDGQKTAECVVTVTKKDDPKPTTPTTPTVKPGDNGQAGSNNGTTTETTAKTAANNGTNPNTSLTTQEKVGTMLVWCTVTALCVLAVFSIKRRQTK